MRVTIEHPQAVSGLAWTVLRGTREQVMRGVGDAHADDIRAVREGDAWGEQMVRAQGQGADRLDAVIAASTRRLPVEAQEIAWLAAGAGVPERDVWAWNLRGDLGDDGLGCSDLARVTPAGVVMGHNEDGDARIGDRVRLLTLDIEGDPSVTALWYPGMLPSNAFVTSDAGLSFGMDHVPAPVADLTAAGRHLVARHAQRMRDGGAARREVSTVPCAGGFAFDIADGPGHRADIIENIAGRVAATPVHRGSACHTNHTIGALAPRGGEAGESGARLSTLRAAATRAADADGVTAALRTDGVLGRSRFRWTFATMVVDTGADRISVTGADSVWNGRLSAFASGRREEI